MGKNERKHLAPSWKIRPKLRRFFYIFFISPFLNFAAEISASLEHCFLPLSSPSSYPLHARPTTRPSPSRAAPRRTITISLHPMRGWQRTIFHQLQRREFVGVFQKGLLKLPLPSHTTINCIYLLFPSPTLKNNKKASNCTYIGHKNVLDVSKTLKKESVSSVHRYKNVLDVSKTIKKESVSMYRG